MVEGVGMIVLKPVDESSYQAVLDLTVAEEDKGLVAPNVRSLADAWLYRENGSGKELDGF
ncbi:hypothetical protein [Streptococcus suis]